MSFNGLHMCLGNLPQLSNAVTRSITAENVYGEKGKGGMADLAEQPQPEVKKIGQQWDGPNGCARDLGRKWKVRPCITLAKESVTTGRDRRMLRRMSSSKSMVLTYRQKTSMTALVAATRS